MQPLIQYIFETHNLFIFICPKKLTLVPKFFFRSLQEMPKIIWKCCFSTFAIFNIQPLWILIQGWKQGKEGHYIQPINLSSALFDALEQVLYMYLFFSSKTIWLVNKFRKIQDLWFQNWVACWMWWAAQKIKKCQDNFLNLNKTLGPLTAIASAPGSGNTWARYLIQQFSGHTGRLTLKNFLHFPT